MTIDTIVLSNGDSADVGDRIRDKGTNPDDPPIIFGWATMRNLLDLMNDPVAQANAPPQPFAAALVGMVTEDALRLALINLFRVPGSAQPIGCTCLPCTGAEYGTTSGRMMLLCCDPWIHFGYDYRFPHFYLPLDLEQPRHPYLRTHTTHLSCRHFATYFVLL
jgi:hypothetical protein